MTASLPPRPASAVSVEDVLAGRRSVRNFSNAGLSLDGAAQLLWAAQEITHSEGLRAAIRWRFTSSPALSPHCRPAFTGTDWSAPSPATDGEIWPPQAPPELDCRCPVVVIAAMFRRTSVKYGERGGRYVHIEAGHAAENVCLQAVALGLGTTVVGAFSDVEVKRLLGLGEEEPLLLIPVGKPG